VSLEVQDNFGHSFKIKFVFLKKYVEIRVTTDTKSEYILHVIQINKVGEE